MYISFLTAVNGKRQMLPSPTEREMQDMRNSIGFPQVCRLFSSSMSFSFINRKQSLILKFYCNLYR